jgi:DNA end-binding protein Ku
VPASRAYWKGYLKLSFVSCPIALYAGTSVAERISFRQVNRRTGHRLRHKLVDSVTGEAVDPSNKARGYEISENDFLLVEDSDLARARSARPPPGAVDVAEPPRREGSPTVAAGRHEQDADEAAAEADDEVEEIAPVPRPQNTRTIEIERFIPAGQIDARYFEKPYYIVPREEIGQEPFAVIRDAMGREGLIGLGRIVLSSRERPLLVEPMGAGLRGVTLRFSHEVRGEEDYFSEIPQMKLPVEMMELAQHIIRTKAAEFDPSMLADHYRSALVGILRKKQARPAAHAVPMKKPAPENVVNLMDALRRSIAAEPSGNLAPKRARAKPPARRPARARRAG